eukprot:3325911-Prymnesium_polylepis.1
MLHTHLVGVISVAKVGAGLAATLLGGRRDVTIVALCRRAVGKPRSTPGWMKGGRHNRGSKVHQGRRRARWHWRWRHWWGRRERLHAAVAPVSDALRRGGARLLALQPRRGGGCRVVAPAIVRDRLVAASTGRERNKSEVWQRWGEGRVQRR